MTNPLVKERHTEPSFNLDFLGKKNIENDKQTESSFNVDLHGVEDKAFYSFSKWFLKSGMLVLVIGAGVGNFNNTVTPNNSLSLSRQTYISSPEKDSISKQNPNTISFLGSFWGAGNVEKHLIDNDFEFSIANIDDLENIEVMPANNYRTIDVSKIVRTTGKIIEPDYDDFAFVPTNLDQF
jgi:hypothetical protein